MVWMNICTHDAFNCSFQPIFTINLNYRFDIHIHCFEHASFYFPHSMFLRNTKLSSKYCPRKFDNLSDKESLANNFLICKSVSPSETEQFQIYILIDVY